MAYLSSKYIVAHEWSTTRKCYRKMVTKKFNSSNHYAAYTSVYRQDFDLFERPSSTPINVAVRKN